MYSGNYIIPSDNRELQPGGKVSQRSGYYIIPSDNRELQLLQSGGKPGAYYIIPSDNRELQRRIRLINIKPYCTKSLARRLAPVT